jgi:DNA-binding beta-propeller fold protein YncE
VGTRNVITLAGFVVGAFFGAPQVGLLIGSLVGGIVDPVQIEGPRLSDARGMTARDGVPIPWGRGTFRVDGTLIACQPGPPTEHKHTESNKGGPEQITYTYTRTHAVLICEGEITGVRRIWRNGKLVYDARPEPTQRSGEADADFEARLRAWLDSRAGSSEFEEKFTLYLGTSSQLPDPELEALFGAGEVSAFRDIAYIVIVDDDVTDSIQAIPQYSFEVVTGQVVETGPYPDIFFGDIDTNRISVIDRVTLEEGAQYTMSGTVRGISLSPVASLFASCDWGSGNVSVVNYITRETVATYAVGTDPWACEWSRDGLFLYVVDHGDDKVRKVEALTGLVAATSSALASGITNESRVIVSPDGADVWVNSLHSFHVLDPDTLIETTDIASSNNRFMAMTPDGAKIFATHQSSTELRVVDTASRSVVATLSLDGRGEDLAIDPTGTYCYVLLQTVHEAVQRVTVATNTVGSWVNTDDNEVPTAIAIDRFGRYAFVMTGAFSTNIFRLSDFTLYDVVPMQETISPIQIAGRSLP